MKNLKITILDFDDIKNPILNAGQARATYEVGKRLASRGHTVTVYCSRFPGYKDRTEEGISYKHIGIGTNNLKLNNIAYILSIPLTVSRIKADLVLECFTAPISTMFSPLFTKLPVVALPTQYNAKAFSEKYHLPFERIENFGTKFYKYFLPYTKFDELKIKKLNPKIVSKIVPEGVDESFFSIKLKKAKHILYLGRLDINQKGIDLLLLAYKKLKDPKYPLIIAGNGPDEAKVKLMVKELGLEKKVKVVGPAYGSKKHKLMSESLFVVFPSRFEGFPLFSLEALAAGLPIVSFDIPGLSWIDKNATMKAKQFDIDEYTNLIRKAFNVKTVKTMSRRAKVFSKKYTWDYVAEEFETFFKGILNKSKGGLKYGS